MSVYLINGIKKEKNEKRTPQPYLINPCFKKGGKMAKKRKTRKIKRTKKLSNYWLDDFFGHSKASKKGWRKRKRRVKGYKSPKKIRGRYVRIKNPFGRAGNIFGDLLNTAKDTGMIFVGYAGTNYIFNTFGGKLPFMDKPIVRGIVKMLISGLVERNIGKNIAMGIAMSGFKDVITAVSPQVAGMLSASEISGFLPDTNVSGYITDEATANVSGYLSQTEEEF